jgi:Phosphotransferase enzyme family
MTRGCAVGEWIRSHVEPVGQIEMVYERPWATVLRVPLANGWVWFKACAVAQAFEPRLTAELFARWPDRVGEVLAADTQLGWLLLADAGTPLRLIGNPPEAWLRALPHYAELQRGEAAHAHDHLPHGVPDRRLATWPARYMELLQAELPLAADDIRRLTEFAPRFERLCNDLAAYGLPDTLQHDDLHDNNLFTQGTRLRVLDWGDSSISHPFASLVVTFRFLEEINKLPPEDTWFPRLRDAYLEPWGRHLVPAFALALRLGTFAHTFGWVRQRNALPDEARFEFDRAFATVLRRAIAMTRE